MIKGMKVKFDIKKANAMIKGKASTNEFVQLQRKTISSLIQKEQIKNFLSKNISNNFIQINS